MAPCGHPRASSSGQLLTQSRRYRRRQFAEGRRGTRDNCLQPHDRDEQGGLKSTFVIAHWRSISLTLTLNAHSRRIMPSVTTRHQRVERRHSGHGRREAKTTATKELEAAQQSIGQE